MYCLLSSVLQWLADEKHRFSSINVLKQVCCNVGVIVVALAYDINV